MSLTGFGDVGRSLAVKPLPLDSTKPGNKNRDFLSQTAGMLKDSDRNTDLFGAIHQVLVEVSKMDPSLRRSAPPALVILSDFRPDPIPDPKEKSSVCDELKRNNIDLVEVGFGDLDRATLDYLAECAGTSPWGIISDPAALPEIFWKLQNRFTKSLEVIDAEISLSKDIQIRIPEWATELLVIGVSSDGQTTSDWGWTGQKLLQVQQGERYRFARLLLDEEARTSGSTSVHFSGAGKVRMMAVARGPLGLRVNTTPPSPWISGENVSVGATLISNISGKTVTEWEVAAGAEDSGELKTSVGSAVPLDFDPVGKSFKGTITVSAGPRLAGEVLVSINGAIWPAHFEGTVTALPVGTVLDALGRMVIQTWTPGRRVKRRLTSTLPNTEFDVTLETTGPMDVEPKHFTFNSAEPEASLLVRSTEPQMSHRRMLDWLEDSPPQFGSIIVTTRLPSGQLISSSQPIPVVFVLRPLWERWAVAIGGIVILVLALFSVVRGRRLPAWYLVESDASGNPIPGTDPARLRCYRRSLDLGRLGMPGVVIYKSLNGRVGARMQGNVALLRMGCAKPAEPMQTYSDTPIGVGDTLESRRPDGSPIYYKIDTF